MMPSKNRVTIILELALVALVLICGCEPPELQWGYWEPARHVVDYDAELDKPTKVRQPSDLMPLEDLVE